MEAPACSPRIRVAAVLPQPDGIVLVRHRKDGADYFLLPGGGVERGETLADALVREVLEETGRTCEPVAVLFINDSIDPSGGRHLVQVTFLARETGHDRTAPSADARVAGTVVIDPALLDTIDLRPPFAAALSAAAVDGYASGCTYLGALWETESGIATTGRSAATDG